MVNLCVIMATKTHQPSRRHKKRMTVYIMLISLLPLTVTAGQTHNTTAGQVKGINFTDSQQTTPEMRMLVNVSSQTFTPPTNTSMPSTPTMHFGKFRANTSTDAQTAASPSNSMSVEMSNSTAGMELTSMSTTTLAVNETTTNVTATPRFTRPSQSQNTKMTSTPVSLSDKVTFPSTNVIPTSTASPRPAQNNSTTTLQATTSEAKLSTSSYQTSTATTKRPVIHTTKANKDHLGTGNQETKHGKTVAGLIGGALVLMMVGFLVIYIKKRKLQKQQITTSDWAGPTPFLEGGADNGQVTLRSSNRISISSFLPQRLSKRLSLLPEVGEEMEDMTPGSTFGDKLISKDAPETAKNSVNSLQATNPLFINDEVKNSNHNQSENPQTPPGKVDEPPAEQKDDVGQP